MPNDDDLLNDDEVSDEGRKDEDGEAKPARTRISFRPPVPEALPATTKTRPSSRRKA